MLPNNTLSTQAVSHEFFTPVRMNDLIDYEWGGVDLYNVTQGLNASLWSSSYENGKIVLANENVRHEILTVANVTEISFAFDLNMNPYVTYVAGGVAYLYWYDTSIAAHTTTNLGTGILNPRLSLDERRIKQVAISDVVLGYIRGGNLCVKYQRTRFATEIILGPMAGLIQVGMMKNYRFGFLNIQLVKYY